MGEINQIRLIIIGQERSKRTLQKSKENHIIIPEGQRKSKSEMAKKVTRKLGSDVNGHERFDSKLYK